MPRRHLYLPSHYSNLLGRLTLAALLLAGAGGITWDLAHTPRSELRGFNEQLIAANDVLLSRAMSVGDVDARAGMARAGAPLADAAAQPGNATSLVAQQ